MEGRDHHHRLHHPQNLYHQQHLSVNMADTGDRFPQWSLQETKEFLAIRADLDRTFMETKRNKLLWEVISTKMKEKGYTRSPEQCKCKWKNLVTRYKGCETIEPESMRQQFPFYNELQAIFTSRMQRMLWLEEEAGAATSSAVVGGRSSKKKGPRLSSDDEDDNEESEGDNRVGGKKKKKSKAATSSGGVGVGVGSSSNNNNLQEIIEDFMRQQIQMEVQWREAVEAREEEGRLKELEWRQTMEALQKERLMMERRWREREEQRQMREEARAEKRDSLITALLNKLRREERDL